MFQIIFNFLFHVTRKLPIAYVAIDFIHIIHVVRSNDQSQPFEGLRQLWAKHLLAFDFIGASGIDASIPNVAQEIINDI
jgi:hypothetical protein